MHYPERHMNNTLRNHTETGTTETSRRSLASTALMMLPFIIYITVFKEYVINMPFFDDFDAVLGWMDQFLSSKSPHEKFLLLFQQHNEHRIVFDYLIELLCFHAIHKINFIFLSFVGSLGLFGIVVVILYAGKKAGFSYFELIPIPFLLLTLSQNQLIYFAMASLQQNWQLLFELASLIVLIRFQTRRGLASAGLLGLAASFTGGGGLLVYPAGFLYLALSKRWSSAMVWTIFAAVTAYIYFVALEYQSLPSDQIAHAYAKSHPFTAIVFSIQFLGNFAHNTTGAFIFGAVSIVVFSILYVLNDHNRQAPFAYIFLLILASAILVGLDRSILGPQESIASRYAIYGLLNLASIYMMIILTMQEMPFRNLFASAGILISIGIYLSWISPALATLGYIHKREQNSLIWGSTQAAATELQAAMNSGVFYPEVLFRHMPTQFAHNPQYNQAWRALFFDVYLMRPDLQSNFPLNTAASYAALLHWAAITIPQVDPAFVRLQPFQSTYQSMLGLLNPQ